MPSDGCFAPILVQCSGVNMHVMATHTHDTYHSEAPKLAAPYPCQGRP